VKIAASSAITARRARHLRQLNPERKVKRQKAEIKGQKAGRTPFAFSILVFAFCRLPFDFS
jgi:hypothetical protein